MADENRDQPAAEPGPKNTPDAWAASLGVSAHMLAGAKQHNHWVQGDELTEAEFRAGLAAFAEEPLR